MNMKTNKIVMMIALWGLMALQAVASQKTAADEAYAKNQFKQAIQLYEQVLADEGESADVYYNLGNSYYKDKQIAKAVLNYERALLLQPGDADIRFNLEVARSKTVDKVTEVHEVFFVSWYHDLAHAMSEKGWASWAIAAFILGLLGWTAYFLARLLAVRKVGFIGGIVLWLVCLLANVCASSLKEELVVRDTAIIMAPSITVTSTPSQSGTQLFQLHEGRKVTIKDNSMKEWKEIKLEDGNVGWVPASALEII
jgi:tetratricopeptide (TPR) repeat protein